MNKHKSLVGGAMLFFASFIWGTTFIAQSEAMASVGPFVFQAIRTAIGAVFLTVLYFVTQRKKSALPFKRENIRYTLTAGTVCGVLLFIATNLQQIGLIGAAPGKAAFITSLYIIFVPILGVFVGKRVGITIWGCAAVSLVGFYLLNITDDVGFGLSGWDIAVLICAVAFSFHIIMLDRFAPKINTFLLSAMQFWVVAILSAVCIFMDEAFFEYSLPTLDILGDIWFNLVYAGLFSSGIAYTLQIAGQKRMNATTATLIMSLESVVAAVSAWIFNSKNAMTAVQVTGCVMIFTAICVAQLPFEKKAEHNEETNV